MPEKLLLFAGVEDCFTQSIDQTATVKVSFAALSKTRGFLTPDLWPENQFGFNFGPWEGVGWVARGITRRKSFLASRNDPKSPWSSAEISFFSSEKAPGRFGWLSSSDRTWIAARPSRWAGAGLLEEGGGGPPGGFHVPVRPAGPPRDDGGPAQRGPAHLRPPCTLKFTPCQSPPPCISVWNDCCSQASVSDGVDAHAYKRVRTQHKVHTQHNTTQHDLSALVRGLGVWGYKTPPGTEGVK